MKTLLIHTALCIWASAAMAQASFRVELRRDTVGLNEHFELRYVLENAEVQQFAPPSLNDFRILSGPSTMTSVSIVNGKTSRTASYTYWVQALAPGRYQIPSAQVRTKEGTRLETGDLSLVVVEYREAQPQERQGGMESFGFNFGQPSMPDWGNNPFFDDFFNKGGGNNLFRMQPHHFFNDQFNSFFRQMPNPEDMLRQWEQMLPQPPKPSKKEEKTYKL